MNTLGKTYLVFYIKLIVSFQSIGKENTSSTGFLACKWIFQHSDWFKNNSAQFESNFISHSSKLYYESGAWNNRQLNLSTTATLGTGKSGFKKCAYCSIHLKICNKIKIYQQNRNQTQNETNDAQYRSSGVNFFNKKWVLYPPFCQLLISWPLLKGYFSSSDAL